MLGRDVGYRRLTTEEHVAVLTGVGLDEPTARFVAGMDAGIAAGALALVLLALGMTHGAKVTTRLKTIVDRFSTGTIERSVPAACTLFVLAAAVLAVALWP